MKNLNLFSLTIISAFVIIVTPANAGLRDMIEEIDKNLDSKEAIRGQLKQVKNTLIELSELQELGLTAIEGQPVHIWNKYFEEVENELKAKLEEHSDVTQIAEEDNKRPPTCLITWGHGFPPNL